MNLFPESPVFVNKKKLVCPVGSKRFFLATKKFTPVRSGIEPFLEAVRLGSVRFGAAMVGSGLVRCGLVCSVL